jgi:hypothetical protein
LLIASAQRLDDKIEQAKIIFNAGLRADQPKNEAPFHRLFCTEEGVERRRHRTRGAKFRTSQNELNSSSQQLLIRRTERPSESILNLWVCGESGKIG